jgi:hypothetical protein
MFAQEDHAFMNLGVVIELRAIHPSSFSLLSYDDNDFPWLTGSVM